MLKKRLFTFGCSFTKYKWPSWADIIGTNYEIHHNFGYPGAGNYYIALKLYETDLNYKINKDDDVLIMLSSVNRFDIYDERINRFNLNGNIYNSEHIFGKKFVNEIWNDTHSIYNTWFSVKSIKSFLDLIGCNYKIVEAFGLLNTDDGNFINVNDFIKLLLDDYKNCVYTTENLQKFSQNYNPSSYILENGNKDGHPTITCNHDFVKTHMNEFYHNEMNSIANKWESEVTANPLESKFSSQKIKSTLF